MKKLTEKQLDKLCRKNIEKGSIKALGGIDTLYFFSDVTGQLYHNFYFNDINNLEKGDVVDYQFANALGAFLLYKIEYLGYSGLSTGFIGYWFKLYVKCDEHYMPIARIGFKNPTKQHNVLNSFVQLEGTGIYTFGILKCCSQIFDFLNNMFACGVGFSNSQVTRADVNAFVNYDFSNIDRNNFKTSLSFEGETVGDVYQFGKRGNIETINIGRKSSKIYFKIYNKLLELNQKRDTSSFIKMAYLSAGFHISPDDISRLYSDCDVWNIEFSFNREALKEFEIYTLDALLNSTQSLFQYGMNYVVFLGYDTATIKKKREDKKSLLEPYILWNYIKNNVVFNSFEFGDDYIYRTVKKSKEAHLEYYLMMIEAQFKHIRNNGLFLSRQELLKRYDIYQ